MKTQEVLFSAAMLACGASAASVWLDQPDTGLEVAQESLPAGQLPPLDAMVGLPDFEWAASNYLPLPNYTYYRNGAAGEWSYRFNLEIFQQYHFRPRTMIDITNIESTLPTTILGHNFSAPFFISPCARAERGHPEGELNLVRGAAAGDILYIPSLFAHRTVEEIAAAKAEGQVVFQQLYLTPNDTETQLLFDRLKKAGTNALVFTVDSAGDGNRHRAARFGVGSADSEYSLITWDYYKKLTSMTDLPIILKGVSTVEDVKTAIKNKVPAIILSNHGGRQLDTAQSSLESALEIHKEDPKLFKQIEIYADGGVRYGSDILKLLSLGVKAVGLGRSFMYANAFGQPGVEKAISILKREIANDAANLGVADLKKINPNYVKWTIRGYSS